jgi:hypothetical protein
MQSESSEDTCVQDMLVHPAEDSMDAQFISTPSFSSGVQHPPHEQDARQHDIAHNHDRRQDANRVHTRQENEYTDAYLQEDKLSMRQNARGNERNTRTRGAHRQTLSQRIVEQVMCVCVCVCVTYICMYTKRRCA